MTRGLINKHTWQQTDGTSKLQRGERKGNMASNLDVGTRYNWLERLSEICHNHLRRRTFCYFVTFAAGLQKSAESRSDPTQWLWTPHVLQLPATASLLPPSICWWREEFAEPASVSTRVRAALCHGPSCRPAARRCTSAPGLRCSASAGRRPTRPCVGGWPAWSESTCARGEPHIRGRCI